MIRLGGMMAKGGRLLTTRERYILELKGLAEGLRPEAIDKFIDDNDLTNDEILNIIVGLGRKQISSSDFVTALIGNKNNQKFQNLMAFIKSDKAMRLADGGKLEILQAQTFNTIVSDVRQKTTLSRAEIFSLIEDFENQIALEDNKSKSKFAKGGMMAKGKDVRFYEGQSVIYFINNDKKMDKFLRYLDDKFSAKELVIDKITVDRPFNTAKVFDRNSGEKVPFDLILDSRYVEQYADGGMTSSNKVQNIKERLEELRTELRAEKISYGELVELESYSDYIDKDDVELLEAAGVSEFDDDEMAKGGILEQRALRLFDKLKQEGKLKRYIDTRGDGKKYFETIVPNYAENGYWRRFESTSRGSIGVLQNEYLDKNDVLNYLKKTIPALEENDEMANGGMTSINNVQNIKERLEELRTELRAEKISYGELVELQSYSDYIDKDDVELLEAAGVSEFDDDEMADGGITPNKPSRKMSAMMDALGVGSTKNEKPMTEKPYMKPITINLLGPEGNAYYLIGTARRLSKQLGLDGDEITKQMMSGDYENLLEVFESNFGDFVTLVR